MDAIVVEDLRKRYKTVQALDGVSFAVREGEVFGLLGPNGAGKSTAVRVLTTLTQADSGTASVAGRDVVREPNRVRRAIGYVAQDSGVDWEATGRENLLLQGRIHGMGGAPLRKRVDELLELVGLADSADRIARGYSGGMKRRLDVAIGLVHKPRVLFLDEPTTGLDPRSRQQTWEIVRTIVAEPTTLLRTLGVPEVVRDAFDERAHPDDVYDLAPRTLADLEPDLGPELLVWGMAKAKLLRGRGQSGRAGTGEVRGPSRARGGRSKPPG